MKVAFKYYAIQASILWIASFMLILSSCNDELRDRDSSDSMSGITFSLGIEQDEISVATTRAGGKGEDKIRQMKYFIRKYNVEGGSQVISTGQEFLSSDFSQLKVEGLLEGKYAIIFYATTSKDINIPQPDLDGFLTNPSESMPLNVDYLFGRADFKVDGINKPLPITVTLKRCVGQVHVDIKGFPYLKRLIKNVEIDIVNSNDIYTTHTDNYGIYSETGGTIKKMSMHPDTTSFYSFPSSKRLSGSITVRSVLQDEKTPVTKIYRFNNLMNIEEGKITTIQVDWNSPDNYGVVYVAHSDFTPENSSEILTTTENNAVIRARTFFTDKPLQVKIGDDYRLHLTSYTPIDIKHVKVMCRISAYSKDYFQIAYYEVYPGWHDSFWEIPLTKKTMTYKTEAGNLIEIPAQPALSQKDCEFKIISDDDLYMKKVNRITYPIKIYFNVHELGYQRTLSPELARHACVLAVNTSVLFSSPEFEQQIRTYKEIPFATDTCHVKETLIPPQKLIDDARMIQKIILYEIYDPDIEGGGVKLGRDSAMLGVRSYIYEGMYKDMSVPVGYRETYYHEFGHCMGYHHGSSITAYDKKWFAWQNCCIAAYDLLSHEGKIPIEKRLWNDYD